MAALAAAEVATGTEQERAVVVAIVLKCRDRRASPRCVLSSLRQLLQRSLSVELLFHILKLHVVRRQVHLIMQVNALACAI